MRWSCCPTLVFPMGPVHFARALPFFACFCFRSYNSKHFCWMCDATLDGNQWFMLGAVSKPFQIEVGVPNFCFATRPLGLALALGTRMTVDIHEAICALLSTKQMLHIVPL